MTTTTGTTLRQFAESLSPGTFPDDWMVWPPDAFALTSAVFKQTGCYREALALQRPMRSRWQASVERCATAWFQEVNHQLLVALQLDSSAHGWPSASSLIERELASLKGLAATVTLDELRALQTRESRELAKCLIALHAVADEACTGLGLVGPVATQPAPIRCLANLLLTATGSLASLPKQHGIVLPKMRTPQTGLTVRSMAHQVTFHTTEVEVMWRTIPWANIHENTINLLLVPWPKRIDDDAFAPADDTFETVRYFSYEPPANGEEHLAALVDLVWREERRVGRVHVIVFPEVALRRDDMRKLLSLLRARHELEGEPRLRHVPMVVAGTYTAARDAKKHEGESSADLPTGDGAPALNEVILATYFADKWYELSQLKHHRWKINRDQLRQYGLEGRLSTARSWYEHSLLSQRRLTFLAPTPWLALCPLICEDLAQLEPVSELLRGVGPTLLTALLMDGPQLKHRWSARYASVLADDPGTAVLTLSSLGMVKRSRPHAGDTVDPETGRVVGLWKDQLTGWQPLVIGDDDDAMLMTVSAAWSEEFSADGRGDHAYASAFRFEGATPCKLTKETAETSHPPMRRRATAFDIRPGDWADIREITASTFVVDCLLDTRGEWADEVLQWLLADDRPMKAGRLADVVQLATRAAKDPASVGIKALRRDWPNLDLRRIAAATRDWAAFMGQFPEAEHNRAVYLGALAAEAGRRLKGLRLEMESASTFDQADEIRLRKVVALVVLFGVHARVDGYRRPRQRAHGAGTEYTIEQDDAYDARLRETAMLLSDVETMLETYA